jgi:hypothetical protein
MKRNDSYENYETIYETINNIKLLTSDKRDSNRDGIYETINNYTYDTDGRKKTFFRKSNSSKQYAKYYYEDDAINKFTPKNELLPTAIITKDNLNNYESLIYTIYDENDNAIKTNEYRFDYVTKQWWLSTKTEKEYDNLKRIIKETVGDNVTHYSYLANNVVSITDSYGTNEYIFHAVYGYIPISGNKIVYNSDNTINLIQMPWGNSYRDYIKFFYNNSNLYQTKVLSLSSFFSSSNIYDTYNYFYDTNQRLIKTTIDFDSNNNVDKSLEYYYFPKTCQADSYQCPSCQSYETLSYNENGSGYCSTNNYSLTISSNDISQGTVSKDLNGTTFGYGSVVQITALPLTGYKFEKWSDDNITNPREVTIKANTTLSASFVAKTCQVDNYNCPSCQSYQTLTYNNSTGAGSCVNKTYPISYLPSDSTMGQITSNQSGTSLVWGTTFTLTATPLEGFKFVTWSDNNTTNPRVVTVNQAIDLNATFAPKTCQADSYQCPSCLSYETLSYNENGSGYCSTNNYSLTISSSDTSKGTVSKDLNGTTFGYGSVIQITALPLTGYKFEKWSDDNTTNPREVTIKANTTLSASFVAKTCQADNYNCPTTQLALKGGWNLVSLPINTTLYQSSNDISNKFGNDVVIWTYNKDKTNQWSVYANGITIPSTVDSLLTIKSGEGFWIKIPSDINRTIVFDSNNTYDVTTKVDINSLSPGWYLLGTGITKTVTELQSSNQNISLLWKYLNGAWQTSFNGILPKDVTKMDDVKVGEGVWVLVK